MPDDRLRAESGPDNSEREFLEGLRYEDKFVCCRSEPHLRPCWEEDCPENVCPKCKGKGTLPGSNYVAPNKSGPPNCFVCNGEGRLR